MSTLDHAIAEYLFYDMKRNCLLTTSDFLMLFPSFQGNQGSQKES